MVKITHIVLGAPDIDAVYPVPNKQDTVIGVDRGAMECLKRNIPLSVAIGDFDSISIEEKEILKNYAKVMDEFESDKDDTDGELAIQLAMRDKNTDKIIIYNWLGGRVDHLLAILYLAHQPRFSSISNKLIFKNRYNHVSFYKPGDYIIEALSDKKYISFIGMTPVEDLTLRNVKYPLEAQSYAYPVTLISNEVVGETCELSFKEGLISVIQSADSN